MNPRQIREAIKGELERALPGVAIIDVHDDGLRALAAQYAEWFGRDVDTWEAFLRGLGFTDASQVTPEAAAEAFRQQVERQPPPR